METELKIAGLDLGKTWGWATISSFEDVHPILGFGEKNLGSDAGSRASSGMLYYTFRRWLLDFLDEQNLNLLVFESVRFNRGVSYIGGQTGILLAELEKRRVPYYGLAVGTLKKWATGKGNSNKEEMIRAAMNRWEDPDGFAQPRPWDKRRLLTDNAADALWCAHHGWATWS